MTLNLYILHNVEVGEYFKIEKRFGFLNREKYNILYRKDIWRENV